MKRALALALLVSGCILQPTVGRTCDPDGTPDCATCLGWSGCGFCGTTSRCVPGTSLGPDNETCEAQQWFFQGCGAPTTLDSCTRHADCGSCLFSLGAPSGCEWCPESHECLTTGRACARGSNITDYDSCNRADCAAITNCDDCLATSPCEWCDVQGGICFYEGSCPSAYWYFRGGGHTCPPANHCSQNSSCSSCLGAPGCVWCESTDPTCTYGNLTDWCADFELRTSSCF